jgi:Acetyltransferase (GNAT) domain
VTRLDRLDGPATAAISEQLVAVYRAAMGAAPFHETEVETGRFAEELAGELEEPGFRCWVANENDRVVGFAYGYETPQVPSEGWYGLLRDAVGQGPDGAGRWLEAVRRRVDRRPPRTARPGPRPNPAGAPARRRRH